MGTDTVSLQPLIDLDIILYRCGFAADSQMKKEALEAEPDATPERVAEMLKEVDYFWIARYNANTVMTNLTEKFTEPYHAYIQGEGNFREQLASLKPYKGNRDPNHKPKYYKELGQFLIDEWKAEIVTGQESDDAIGIYQCNAGPMSTVICSIDKDMDQIPGYHFNWVKDSLYTVEEDQADKMLFWQMLVGDTVDNIPGITGIGPKRASKIIDDCHSLAALQHAVREQYAKQYGPTWESAYYEVGNLLYIRRQIGESCPLL